ncbi:DMT family transporter [Chryseosolibacter indicus]|uniref:DMT family transporter n=1 Tax=Chryseosolibacter indicus TaxID=2782351 RepID=A0ABS5VNK6_9BACT|nr:DMT family transporter [Chryseosolibacter indicus]MBT1702716.1 DMT family transporter [Chryseosolibacter indicus]
MASQGDYLKLHFIVFLWGFSAILGKLVTIPAVEMVLFRSLIAIAGMGLVIYYSKGIFKVTGNQLIKLLLIGSVVALHWIAFFGSARVSNVSVSLVGFATNSLWAAILEPWFNKTKMKKFEIVLGFVVLTGLYIIFSFDFQYKLGLIFGVLAGFTSALFSVFNSKMVKGIPARTITFYEMIGVFVTTALFLPVYKHLWAANNQLQLIPGAWDWVWIGLLAVVCSVYAYTVAVELMKRISVFMIQLTLNLEPVYGIIMAVIIFGQQEKMTLNFYVGTLVILGAVVSYPLLKRRFDRVILPME